MIIHLSKFIIELVYEFFLFLWNLLPIFDNPYLTAFPIPAVTGPLTV